MPLLKVEPARDNDIRKFQRHWNYVFAGLTDLPDPNTVTSIYCDRLRESRQLQSTLQIFERGISNGDYGRAVQKDYATLWHMVERLAREEQEAADSHHSMATAAPTDEEDSAPWASQGNCANWVNQGHCYNPSCPFQHHKNMRGQNDDAEEEDTSRNYRSPPVPVRTCVPYMHGYCTASSQCEFYHPPPCRFYAAGQCKDGGSCRFLHSAPPSGRSTVPKAKPGYIGGTSRQRGRAALDPDNNSLPPPLVSSSSSSSMPVLMESSDSDE